MSEIITAAEYRARSSKRNKYGNDHKTKVGTEKFASRREALRHIVLKDMEKHGEIFGLTRQPKWHLFVGGKKICTYIGDWQYSVHRKGGIYVVCEDAKGFKTKDWAIKWKLCQALYPEIEWRLS